MPKALYVVEGTNGKADRLRPVGTGADKPFVAPIQPPDPVGFLPYWGMPSFSDEFDTVDSRTPSGVNPTKWNIRDGETLTKRLEWITGRPQNVRVTGGNLVINAIRESGVNSLSGAPQPTDHPYTSAYIDTIGKHDKKYGRWEIRAKLPTVAGISRGLWPALWFRPTNPPAGVDGEIDLMEAYGNPTNQAGYVLGSAIWTLWQNETSTAARTSGFLTPSANNPDLAAGFHTYIFEWTPTSMKFYVDTTLVKTVTSANIAWFDSSFNANFHTRIQLQVGNSYWGFPDPAHPEQTVSPSPDFAIDYVRYYNFPG